MGGLINFRKKLGAWGPKNPQILDPQCNFPFENKTFNNTETVRVTIKVTIERLQEIGVNLSESAIFNHGGRLLATKTAMTSIPVE